MSDLDSFFAKKDKKRGKSSKKFATTEEVAKKLEDVTLKSNDKSKKDRIVSSNNPDDTTNGLENEDEWKEFQEVIKDYSGLKIKIVSDNNQIENENGENDSNEGMDGSEGGKKKAAGPWKMSDSKEEAKPVEEAPSQPQPSNASGTYVPPGRLQKQLAPMNAFGKADAPDMSSDIAFPTLQAAKPGPKVVESVWNKRSAGSLVRGNDSDQNSSSSQVSLETSKPAHTPTPGSYVPPALRH